MAREYIEKQDSLNDGRKKLNKSIDIAHAAEEKSDQAINTSNESKDISQTAEEKANSVQNQFNQVVIDGDSSVEAAQARVGSDGTTYPVLKERLDGEHKEVTAQLAQTVMFANQTNFVDVLKNMSVFNRMRFISPAKNQYRIFLDDGYNFIHYQFIKDNLDDFIKLDYGTSGVIDYGKIETKSASNFTGDWSTHSSNHFARGAGATFQATVRGSDIVFKHYSDDRGGIWEFVVDGNEDSKVEVSTWSETVQTVNLKTIFTGLDPNTPHTIIGTFKGADPLHEPSDGIARGWVYVADVAPESTLSGYATTYINQGFNLAQTSNKEFAFRIVIGDESYWVPDHGTGTAFKSSEPKFIFDGVERSAKDIPLNSYIYCDSFGLEQDIVGKFSNAGDVCSITLKETIGMDGVVNIVGSLTPLQDLRINAGYPAMLPVGSTLDEYITSIGNSKLNNKDNSYDYFTEEKDLAYGACAVSSSNKDYFSAVQVNSPLKSMRLGGEGKPPLEESLFLWKRPSAPKLYWHSFADYYPSVGEKFAWSSSFLIGKVKNVYDFVKA